MTRSVDKGWTWNDVEIFMKWSSYRVGELMVNEWMGEHGLTSRRWCCRFAIHPFIHSHIHRFTEPTRGINAPCLMGSGQRLRHRGGCLGGKQKPWWVWRCKKGQLVLSGMVNELIWWTWRSGWETYASESVEWHAWEWVGWPTWSIHLKRFHGFLAYHVRLYAAVWHLVQEPYCGVTSINELIILRWRHQGVMGDVVWDVRGIEITQGWNPITTCCYVTPTLEWL